MTIETRKKFDHIRIFEISATGTTDNTGKEFYDIIGSLDCEVLDNHQEELTAIENGELGNYSIDAGDFYIYVAIK